MSSLLNPGTGAVLLLLVSALVFVALRALRREREIPLPVRDLPVLDALEHELGRATESGKPIHFALGSGALGGGDTITSLAGLRVLERLVDSAISYDVPPIITVGDPTLLPLAQDVLRRAYERGQITELYVPTQVRFVAPSSLAYAAGAIPAGAPEDAVATVTVGAFGSEVSLVAHDSSLRGAPLLAAVDNPQAIGALYPSVVDLAVGEELYAIGAHVREEGQAPTSLIAEDILRVVIVLAILGAAALALISG